MTASTPLSFAVVASVTSGRFESITRHLGPLDEVVLVPSAESVYSTEQNPRFVHRTLNAWSLLLHPYEHLDPAQTEAIREFLEIAPVGRFRLPVELPREANGPRILRYEPRLFHREATGEHIADLDLTMIQSAPLQREVAQAALHHRLCAAIDWVSQEPKCGAAWTDAAGIYLALRSWRHAEMAARQALLHAIGIEGADATQLLAEALCQQDKFAQVMELCRTEHSLGNATNLSTYWLARTHLALGNVAQAESCLDQARKMDTLTGLTVRPAIFNTEMSIFEATLRAESGDLIAALDILLALPELDLSTGTAAVAAAEILAKLGRDEEALARLKGCYEDPECGTNAMRLSAEIHSRNDRWDLAAGRYEQLWKAGAQDLTTLLHWRNACEQLGHPDRVDQVIAGQADSGWRATLEGSVEFNLDAVPEPGSSHELNMRLATLMMRTGNYREAYGFLEECLKRDPNHSDTLMAVEICRRALGWSADQQNP